MKTIVWQGSSYNDLRALPLNARRDAGYQLDKVPRGLEPNDWKPMATVGRGVREIRIREDDGAFRVIYVASLGDSIYVLHAFQKKSQKTSVKDLNLAKARFKAIER